MAFRRWLKKKLIAPYGYILKVLKFLPISISLRFVRQVLRFLTIQKQNYYVTQMHKEDHYQRSIPPETALKPHRLNTLVDLLDDRYVLLSENDLSTKVCVLRPVLCSS